MSKTYLHSGDIGDIIYALPTIKRRGGGTLFLTRQDAVPKFTEARYRLLKPLIEAQEYIDGCAWHRGERIDHDFTGFRAAWDRERTLVDMQAAWISNKLPLPHEPWLTVPDPIQHNRPVIARSPRYNVKDWDLIWPHVVREFPNALFVGLPDEYAAFVEKFGKYGRVDYEPTSDFLYLARIIAGSSIFIGNQSSPNAIAEGLKHPKIQETFNRDCTFYRDGARYVRTFAEFESAAAPRHRLMIALQFHPGDENEALELARLICDLEPTMRTDVEFALMYTREVKPFIANDIEAVLKQKFASVRKIRSKRFGTGWPMGPNDLWQDGMRQLQGLKKEDKIGATAVFTMEPDCVPLRRDWIKTLVSAWTMASAQGKLVLGHAHNEPKTHINGNAIFDIRILDLIPQLIGSRADTGWDVEHGQALLSVAEDTPFIFQTVRMRGIDASRLFAFRKGGHTPAIYHGVKGCDAIHAAREVLCGHAPLSSSGDCPIGEHYL